MQLLIPTTPNFEAQYAPAIGMECFAPNAPTVQMYYLVVATKMA
ncbi:hypothetical protein [Phormidium sp. CCY1219]|nr:hypothetical protein [Phormidium sp. CCY1219]